LTKLTPLTEYRAVDLDVRSRRSLAPLLKAWHWAQTPGRAGTQTPRWLVVSARGQPKTADQAVRALVRSVERLPAPARRCWNQATRRTFDIGIQAGLAPRCYEDVTLEQRTIQAVARIGGQLHITIYGRRKTRMTSEDA
jgi:hypothetical protein